MRHALRVAVVLALCCSVPAHAEVKKKKPQTCAMTDPTGDVTVDGTGGRAPADHLDLHSVDLGIGAKTLTVTFHVTAADDTRLGAWRLTFRSGATPVYVLASRGTWLSFGDDEAKPGFRGGRVGAPAVDGTGLIAGDKVTVTVPLSAFGKAAPRRGTVLSGFTAQASEKFASLAEPGTPAVAAGMVDRGVWQLSITVGGACRP